MGPVDDSVTTDTKSQSHKVTRIAGQRARPACAPALQPGQRAHRPCRYSSAWVRGCARTHPGSARASCVPQPRPPSAYPAPLLVLSPQFRTVVKKFAPNCPTDPTNFVLVFRSPQTLGVCGELMSNIDHHHQQPIRKKQPIFSYPRV